MARKKNTVFLDKLPDNARNLVIEKKKITISKNNSPESKKKKYSKETFLQFYEGYDFLQNIIVVRPYIQKRYNIDYHLFELLLYIFPLQYFTREDYLLIPKQFRYRKVECLIDKGFVNIAISGKKKKETIFKPSRLTTEIIKQTYECLSGEKKISEFAQNNPLALANATSFEKKKFELIKALNKKETPESKKSLYL